MRKLLINQLNFPSSTIVNRHIPKKSFFDNANLTSSEINLFTADIEGIYLLSVMKPDQLNVAPYKTDDIFYAEVYWIYVNLRDDINKQRIAAAIHRAFPNPVVIIFSREDQLISISTAHKRLNKLDDTRTVLEEVALTDWFHSESLNKNYAQLLLNITSENLTQENIYQFYDDINKWIKVEPTIKLAGRLPEKPERNTAISILEIIGSLKNKIMELEKEEKNQISFGEKMQVHMKKKKIKIKIKDQIERLKELC